MVDDPACAVIRGDFEITFMFPVIADSVSIYEGTETILRSCSGRCDNGYYCSSVYHLRVAKDPNDSYYFVVRDVNKDSEGVPSSQVGEFD